ncbi:MAG: aminotransferase class V-fold PLP-dependent enzyme [Candidatus Eremiobacteraeota bacterium]|nr:aminotransferase class V-fold PLP-dependent enzyme [Candidatus Eremiobacteraeota bacterium]
MAQPPLDRALFPIARDWAYCDHASVGPLPQPTRDILVEIFDAQMRLGKNGMAPIEAQRDAVRAQVAAAINAQPGEIAFMRSSSDGALLVANGVEWRAGDEIVLADDEFGANAYPWLNLRRRGVRIVLARAPGERISPEFLDRVATERTRLVAVSYVGFNDGYRNDVNAIGRWCKERDVLFAVDAMQGFGQLPFDVRASAADFAYCGTAKWLLSPHGTSFVFVRRELVQDMLPSMLSWRSVADPMRFLDYEQALHPDAQRFEGGSLNYPGVAAFGVSLDLLTHAGLENIERHVLALRERLVEGAKRSGIGVKSDFPQQSRSAIVLLDRGEADIDELRACSDAAKVGITVRDVGVRVSPHGYNDESDIDRVLAVLSAACAAR